MSRDVVWRTAAPAAAASGTGLGRGLDRIIADKSRTGGQASVLPLPNREISLLPRVDRYLLRTCVSDHTP